MAICFPEFYFVTLQTIWRLTEVFEKILDKLIKAWYTTLV
jgi:hypothetical protein